MPGHYVQAEYANEVQPRSRRLLRNIYGNGPYIEGWAVYTQQMMAEQGCLGDTRGWNALLTCEDRSLSRHVACCDFLHLLYEQDMRA